jgi:hypothetical protein
VIITHARLVTVLLTLEVPDEADPDDAAGLAATAAESTALQVVSAAAVEGHLPVPGSLVVRRGGEQPFRVEAVYPASAVLVDLAGERIRVPLATLTPDLLDRLGA